jgi:outer membrane protein OmpA-like peptidoglycan-associated protein
MRHPLAMLPLIVPVVLALLVAAPATAEAQGVLKRIRENATKKVDARKAKAEDSVVAAANKMVDSTVEKTGRGVDATVNTVGTVVDTAMNRTERGVASAARSLTGGGPDRIATELQAGRAVVRELEWVNGTAELAPGAPPIIGRIARAMKATASVYLIEAHTEDLGDPAANQTLAEQRATALKARLVAEGVPATRLFAMAFGATRPPADGGTAPRIELAKMQ